MGLRMNTLRLLPLLAPQMLLYSIGCLGIYITPTPKEGTSDNRLSGQRGRVLKSAVIVIDMVAVQNLLAPFCCVFGKDILGYFLLFGSLSKQF